ncbi:hypothetical protein Zmor_011850 [Zophobas morio]|uniref:Flavoprotein domain-containing protein n=1 Tax=Zophobas morio TaxID=2755281 RepID=A0AA38HIT9_9CUCU|nr:hypothetical protein Zmor_011850 [Zophobas morio]
MFDDAPYQPGDEVEHIAFSTNIDLNVVYPTTFDVIGKVANGLANDLATTILAISGSHVKTLIFPGYHTRFDANPFLKRNKDIIYKTNPLMKVYDTIYGVFPDGEVGTG